jgi:hypothetical protein
MRRVARMVVFALVLSDGFPVPAQAAGDESNGAHASIAPKEGQTSEPAPGRTIDGQDGGAAAASVTAGESIFADADWFSDGGGPMWDRGPSTATQATYAALEAGDVGPINPDRIPLVKFTVDGGAVKALAADRPLVQAEWGTIRVAASAAFNPANKWRTTLKVFGTVPDGSRDGGYTRGSLGLSFGGVENDDPVASTDGAFRKLRYSLARLQDIAPRWQMYTVVSGQLASKNLDPTEDFSLGGPGGVRAYAAGEAPGDQGILGTLEVRYRIPLPELPLAAQLIAFVDAGAVQIDKNPYTSLPNSRSMTGAGVGANLFGWDGVEVRASYATPLGPDGENDAGSNGSRGWIQVVATF